MNQQAKTGARRRSLMVRVAVVAIVLPAMPPAGRGAEPMDAVDAKFALVRERLDALERRVAGNSRAGSDAYVRMGLGVAGRFRNPVYGEPAVKDFVWLDLQSREAMQVLDVTEQRLVALEAGLVKPVVVPRPAGGQPVVHGGLLWGRVRTGKGPTKLQPYWYGGYMNYAASAVNTTTERMGDWPGMGVTLLQNAPSLAFVGPGWKPLPNLEKLPLVMQDAADNGVMMDLAISPHIMPDWAVEGSPDVFSSTPAGFIGYNIDHPKARQVMERWLRMYVPRIRDSPALLGLYLSNEPDYMHSGRDQYSRPLWTAWLKEKHGTIEKLNGLYKTTYRNFEDVAPPGVSMPEALEGRRAYYDWTSFNAQHFADWHGWMNGIIKSMAPNALTHIKALRALDHGFDQGFYPLPDLELFSDVTDLADSDAWPTLPAHEGPDQYWWRSQALNYDLLYSFKGQPVVDGENHPIEVPAAPREIPAAQLRSAVWQGALHHRQATALFLWEKWTTGDSIGQLYFRPASIYGANQAMIDMSRYGAELAAINSEKARVALLYSRPSLFWDRDYTKALRAAWTALAFMGQPVTFISERQLTSGRFSLANEKADILILPRGTHMTDGAITGLEKFSKQGGRIIALGNGSMQYDEYHVERSLSASLQQIKRIESYSDERTLRDALKPILNGYGVKTISLTSSADGRDVRDVPYRVVGHGRGYLVPMTNYAGSKQTVKLGLKGRGVDLLSGESVDLSRISLPPLLPRLLRVGG